MKITFRYSLGTVCAFLLLAAAQGRSEEKDQIRDQRAEPPFSVIISKKLDKPILWIKPSADKSGRTPGDIVLAFLKCVQSNDAEGAKKYCSIPPDDHWPPTLEKKKCVLVSGSFQSFFDRTRAANTGSKVVLSSTPIRGKGGWCHLTYAVRDKNETGPRHRRFKLLKIDGEWKIIEPFWWGDIAANVRDEEIYW